MATIRISEETLNALKSRRHTGQSFNGLLQDLLQSPSHSTQSVTPHSAASKRVSLDSQVIDFGDECERMVRMNPGWKAGLSWAMDWWSKKVE